MTPKYLILALLLTSCGLVDDIEEALDPEPEVVTIEHVFRPCAQDSTQAADTAHYAWCEVRPPGAPGVKLSDGGE